MQFQPQVSFQDALELIESFPCDQQQDLIDIVQKRLIENRRDRIAQHINESREDYRQGNVRTGTVDDLMKEIDL